MPSSSVSELATDSAPRKVVPAAQRVLAVLEVLLASQKGLSVSDIARNIGMARSSAFYLIRTIEDCGYITRSSTEGRYTFTSKLLELANRSLGGMGVRRAAAPLLHSLMRRTGMTVHLGVIVQNEVVLVDKVAPAVGLQMATWVGKRLPIHCTALGKALLAHLPTEEIEYYLKNGLIRYNENTIVSPSKLKDEFAKIRARGFAVDDEEETIGLRCVGAPILDQEHHGIAAISIAGTVTQLTDDKFAAVAEQLKEAAASASRQLQTQ